MSLAEKIVARVRKTSPAKRTDSGVRFRELLSQKIEQDQNREHHHTNGGNRVPSPSLQSQTVQVNTGQSRSVSPPMGRENIGVPFQPILLQRGNSTGAQSARQPTSRTPLGTVEGNRQTYHLTTHKKKPIAESSPPPPVMEPNPIRRVSTDNPIVQQRKDGTILIKERRASEPTPPRPPIECTPPQRTPSNSPENKRGTTPRTLKGTNSFKNALHNSAVTRKRTNLRRHVTFNMDTSNQCLTLHTYSVEQLKPIFIQDGKYKGSNKKKEKKDTYISVFDFNTPSVKSEPGTVVTPSPVQRRLSAGQMSPTEADEEAELSLFLQHLCQNNFAHVVDEVEKKRSNSREENSSLNHSQNNTAVPESVLYQFSMRDISLDDTPPKKAAPEPKPKKVAQKEKENVKAPVGEKQKEKQQKTANPLVKPTVVPAQSILAPKISNDPVKNRVPSGKITKEKQFTNKVKETTKSTKSVKTPETSTFDYRDISLFDSIVNADNHDMSQYNYSGIVNQSRTSRGQESSAIDFSAFMNQRRGSDDSAYLPEGNGEKRPDDATFNFSMF
ncbi:hypothetical protein AGDE_16860 [Angomonas deanei]|nr:hypothetical protein AGDE_16860 [Angomonas deanei]|eukprot:EPY16039.1 hypothetical protein AGDE_16860 [Angomonas deanei]